MDDRRRSVENGLRGNNHRWMTKTCFTPRWRTELDEDDVSPEFSIEPGALDLGQLGSQLTADDILT